MARQPITISRVKPVAQARRVLRCPECSNPLEVDDQNPPRHAICLGCAAIAIWREQDQEYSLLGTEDWWALCYQPQHYALMERRMEVLDRLTAPAEARPHVRRHA